jgi:AcrR family transcriptional regulator
MAEKKPEEQRRQEILEAALRCFSKKGYDMTKMEDIVKEAGLTKGGIYWYFNSKREIFLALFDRHTMDDAIKWAELIKINAKAGNLLLDASSKSLKEHIDTSWFIPLIQEMIAESFRDELLREKIYSMFNNEVIYLLIPLLLAGKEVNEDERDKAKNIATAVMAMGYGLAVFYHLSGKKIPFEKIWQESAHALIHGIELPHDDK